MFRAAVSLVALAALTAPAFGQTNLNWKFKEGDQFYLEERMVSKTTSSVAGMTVTEEQTQVRVSSFKVKSRTKDGVVLEQRIESWKSKIVGGQPGAEEGTKLLEQATRGVVFTIELSSSGKVTKFDGYNQMLKKIQDANPEEAKKFKAIATEEVLRAPLVMVFDVLPEKAVKKGESWNKEISVPLGPMGTFKFSTAFTYNGAGDGGEQIGSKGTFSFEPSKADAGDLGFKIVKMDLTKKESTGKLVFDNAKGRLVVNEFTMPLAGTMTIEVQGMQIDVQVDGTETRTLKVLEKRPAMDL
jgi:hypothetical protein